jgi:hypothetical protein
MVGASRVTFVRYLLPLFPGLVVLAARGVLELMRSGRVAATVLAAVWLYSAAMSATRVSTIDLHEQRQAARWIAENMPQRPVRVAFPKEMSAYHALTPFLRRAGLTPLPVESGRWLDATPDVIVVSELQATRYRRNRPDGPEVRDLDRLVSGSAGYHEGARWRPWYLQRELDVWLDPVVGFGPGSYGLTVYVRERQVGRSRSGRGPHTQGPAMVRDVVRVRERECGATQ